MFHDDKCYRRGNVECQAVCVCVGGVGVPFAVLNTLPEEASLRGGPVGQGRKLAMRFSGGKASGRRTG